MSHWEVEDQREVVGGQWGGHRNLEAGGEQHFKKAGGESRKWIACVARNGNKDYRKEKGVLQLPASDHRHEQR